MCIVLGRVIVRARDCVCARIRVFPHVNVYARGRAYAPRRAYVDEKNVNVHVRGFLRDYGFRGYELSCDRHGYGRDGDVLLLIFNENAHGYDVLHVLMC